MREINVYADAELVERLIKTINWMKLIDILVFLGKYVNAFRIHKRIDTNTQNIFL